MQYRWGDRGKLFATAAAVLTAALTVAGGASAATRHTAAPVPVTVSAAGVGSAIPAGFVGLTTELSDVPKEMGNNPTEPDMPFEQLVRNLSPYGGLTLRIGGDSADWAWWPVAGMTWPRWVRWTITPTWTAVIKRLADDLHASLIIGVNMEAGNTRIATTEVQQLSAHLGNVSTTYELGNEPELYSKFPFYHEHGRPVLGRPKSYSFSDITSQWNQFAVSLPHVHLAGPGYSGFSALPDVGQFLETNHQLSLLTVHSYPLKASRCGGRPEASQLFTPPALQDLATEVSSWTSLASQHSLPVRVDEMNSVTCGGTRGVSNSFGPALWALNILPLYAQAGLAGVNFQTRPYTAQNLIQPRDTKSGWTVQVQPEYYGLLAFAELTPPGSRILQVTPLTGGLYSWAVRTPQGQTHVVVTNVGTTAASAEIHASGVSGAATVELLQAESLQSTGRVTLGGQTISPSTGQLTGTPVTTTVPSVHGIYDVTVPASSAAIITFPH